MRNCVEIYEEPPSTRLKCVPTAPMKSFNATSYRCFLFIPFKGVGEDFSKYLSVFIASDSSNGRFCCLKKRPFEPQPQVYRIFETNADSHQIGFNSKLRGPLELHIMR